MKDYIIKTNFGRTYKITPEQVAQDYAECAYQFQEEDGLSESDWKTQDELANEILKDQEWLDQWYNDYIAGDVTFISTVGQIVDRDAFKEAQFLDTAIENFGRQVN